MRIGLAFLMMGLRAATGAAAESAYWTEWTGPVRLPRVSAQAVDTGPAAVAANQADGPAAALALERGLRGRVVNNSAHVHSALDEHREHMYYPEASPVPMDPERIVPMTPELWTDEQILADFRKNRTPEQEGLIIFLKTEYCHKNKFRLCAVATAALDKRSTPALAKFRVYGVWLGMLNPRHKNPAYAAWQERVASLYDFDQGPGSNFFIAVPKPDQETVFFRTDAARLQLYRESFESQSGRAPILEKVLEAALASQIKFR